MRYRVLAAALRALNLAQTGEERNALQAMAGEVAALDRGSTRRKTAPDPPRND
ncbi:MAG TPA: hypothetical protein VFF67_08925 [Thermoplasmata archaeon]|nr:hypothetical protein [Thermoplasmata archaeon]